MLDYYQILGVARDATDDEIKQAYRKKLGTTHPDQGGDHEAMADLNAARDTLLDPDARARYTATGLRSKASGEDEEGVELFSHMLNEAIEVSQDGFLQLIRQKLLMERTAAASKKIAQQDRIKHLRRLQKRIKVKAGFNIAMGLLDAKIADAHTTIRNQDKLLLITAAALTEVDRYEIAPEEEAVVQFQPFGFSTTLA